MTLPLIYSLPWLCLFSSRILLFRPLFFKDRFSAGFLRLLVWIWTSILLDTLMFRGPIRIKFLPGFAALRRCLGDIRFALQCNIIYSKSDHTRVILLGLSRPFGVGLIGSQNLLVFMVYYSLWWFIGEGIFVSRLVHQWFRTTATKLYIKIHTK